MEKTKEKKLPELLAPAGSEEALAAAIEGGADAVYLGLQSFGARAYAKNFDLGQFSEAVKLAHAYGVRVYVTMNTLIGDGEMRTWLDAAYSAACAGADALITADIGCAVMAKKYLPELRLHASTQLTGHSVGAAELLSELGFTRMVCARELSREEVRALCASSPIETEQFIHGALCMSVSGQCLMSSMIGGRSGNRGECAQPCRLPYSGAYSLSLKDLSLASHLPEVADSGVASLKIEGRMKPPEYVYGVTKIYRRLLDGHRTANEDEERELARLFSRGGSFTDGYYENRINHAMLGIRSESDKERTASVAPFGGLKKNLPLDMKVTILPDTPAELAVRAPDGREGIARGFIPEPARTAPIDRETVERSLARLGGTPYSAGKIEITLSDGLMVPVSKLNALRRDALADLEAAGEDGEKTFSPIPERIPAQRVPGTRASRRTAILRDPAQLTPRVRAYFDRMFLPLSDGTVWNGLEPTEDDGAILPPLIYPSEEETAARALGRAAELGIGWVMIQNPGQLRLAKASGLKICGGHRLNVTNSSAADFWLSQGLCDVVLSPELRGAACRDIGGATSVIVYGRIPLMLTEKCLLRELTKCARGGVCPGKALLRDRRGAEFPVLTADSAGGCPAPGGNMHHRSEIFNSLPTSMSDRREELSRYGISDTVFLFSDETPEECDMTVEKFAAGEPLPRRVRRLP